MRLLLLASESPEELRAYCSRFTVVDTDIMPYLTDQVLAKQPFALQQLMLETAIVERFSLPLYRAIAVHESVRGEEESLLAQLLRENLFVTDSGDGWYRYHALFRELLLHECERQLGTEVMAEQHRRASQWFEAHGLIAEAIRHALYAGDKSQAIDVLDRHRVDAMNREEWQLLEHWLAIFPIAMVEQDPLLTATQAWLVDASELEGAQRTSVKRLGQQLSELEDSMDGDLHRRLLGEYSSLMSDLLFLDVNHPAMIEQAQRALDLLPLAHSHGRVIAYIFLSGGYRYTGRLEQSEEILANADKEEVHHNESFGGRLAIPRFVFDLVGLKLARARSTALHMGARANNADLPIVCAGRITIWAELPMWKIAWRMPGATLRR